MRFHWQKEKLFKLVEFPSKMMFKPNKHYVAELEKKDYLGKAKVRINLFHWNKSSYMIWEILRVNLTICVLFVWWSGCCLCQSTRRFFWICSSAATGDGDSYFSLLNAVMRQQKILKNCEMSTQPSSLKMSLRSMRCLFLPPTFFIDTKLKAVTSVVQLVGIKKVSIHPSVRISITFQNNL